MSIAEQMIMVVQSAAIPFLAIMTFIAVISIMKAPGKVTATDEENFKVTESYFWLLITLYSAVAAAIFVWLGVGNETDGTVASAVVMAILCGIAFVFTLYMYFKRKLVVSGDQLTYYPVRGKAETYDVKNIGKMEIVQAVRCEELRVYNRNGKQLFAVNGYMVNAQLLKKYMRKRPVRIVKINLDDSDDK